jgi:hypothetical protein
MGKWVYVKGQAHFLRPFYLDMGDNITDPDFKAKIMKTGGLYSAMIKLPFDNRDDAEEHLNGLGIPTDGLMGNLLKRDKDTKEIFYKITRGHQEPNFEDPYLGPPKVVDAEGEPWEDGVLIGNGSECTFKLDVWIGTKAKKIRWEAVRVDEHIPFETEESGEGF